MGQARPAIGSWAMVLLCACSASPAAQQAGPVLTPGTAGTAAPSAMPTVPGMTAVANVAGTGAVTAGNGAVAGSQPSASVPMPGQAGAPANTAPTPNGDSDADGLPDAMDNCPMRA